MSPNYEWMKLYEAAVLETNPNILSSRIEDAKDAIGQRVVRGAIEDAKDAIGQRVVRGAIDEAERRAVVKTLNAIAVLKRERSVSRNLALLSMQRHAGSCNSHERQDIL